MVVKGSVAYVANGYLGLYIIDVSDDCAEPCYADCDESGTLNILDYICYRIDFAAGRSYADCDNNGMLNILDFISFSDAFAAGCP